MSSPNVVVDGSNIATEGRALPSLAQLDEAVRAYLGEHPDAVVTVVVDATFGHRIDESERTLFEEARAAGEIVSPPAGAIGRGDAFLLRIAEKTGATVLSNDSFQEFHGEHDWLFTTGRLIGGVPVAGVGWIFTPRTPVRGPRSREAVKQARRSSAPLGPAPVPKGPPPGRRPRRGPGRAAPVEQAIKAATQEVVEPSGAGDDGPRRRRRRGSSPPSEPVNPPLPFITFIAEHRLGSELEGEVESFSSHGAFVMVGDVRCYLPLSAMGDPPPRSAREVLTKGQVTTFVVQALDPPRRGVELALPGHARIAGGPTDETVMAEIGEEGRMNNIDIRGIETEQFAAEPVKTSHRGRGAKKVAAGADRARQTSRTAAKAVKAAPKRRTPALVPSEPVRKVTAKKAPVATKKEKAAAVKKATRKAATPAKKATTPKKTAKKAAPVTKKSAKKTTPATKTTAKKKAAPARKSTTKKSPAKSTPTTKAVKKAPAKKAPAKKAKKTR